MGKSNVSKKNNAEFLKQYVRKRQLWLYAVIAAAAAFILLCMVAGTQGGLSGSLSWLIWVGLGLYIFCFAMLRIRSQCPYCGKSIMRGFNKAVNCPYCKRPIKPRMPSATGETLAKNRK